MGVRILSTFMVAVFLGTWPSPSFARGLAARIREIDKSCKAMEASLKAGGPPQVFAVLSMDAPGDWKAYDSEANLLALCPKGCYRKALAYHLSQAPAFVSCEFKGPSKEWVQYLKYYFREDGTLEKIHIDYRRFGAYRKSEGMDQQFLAKVLRDRYYDPQGKCIKKTAPRCLNVSNGREFRDVVFTDASWPVYPKLENLPFYALASAAPAAPPTPLSTP